MTGQYNPLYTLNNQGFVHSSCWIADKVPQNFTLEQSCKTQLRFSMKNMITGQPDPPKGNEWLIGPQ